MKLLGRVDMPDKLDLRLSVLMHVESVLYNILLLNDYSIFANVSM